MSQGDLGWGGGYVTDVAYLPGYYRQQSPLHLNLACLLGGVAGLEIAPGAPLSYLELGCGHGFGALALAASNPAWRVTGIDFNPAHIAAARALAHEAGIGNAAFIEADLASLCDGPQAEAVPDADVVSLHGLWSWVSERTRAGIVRLLAAKLRPGGIAHLSYNALPAWQGALGMQRLLREAGRRQATRSDRQAAAGIDTVRALIDAKAAQLAGNPFVEGILKHADRSQPNYAAHEYMNAHWQPCFHADVTAALGEAKLDWVASAQLLENFPALTLDEPARAVLNRFDDPVMRELVKDMCLGRGLRHDVFVRGARRLSEARRDALLGDVQLALTSQPPQFIWDLDVPAGRATLEGPFFRPIVDALAEGPRRVADLLALPELPRHDNPAEVAGMLVGSEQAVPVLGPPAAAPDPAAARLNAAAARLLVRPDNFSNSMALATAGTGTPLPCSMLELAIADKLRQADAGPAAWADALLPGAGEDEHRSLVELIDRVLAERAPVWRSHGAVPPA